MVALCSDISVLLLLFAPVDVSAARARRRRRFVPAIADRRPGAVLTAHLVVALTHLRALGIALAIVDAAVLVLDLRRSGRREQQRGGGQQQALGSRHGNLL